MFCTLSHVIRLLLGLGILPFLLLKRLIFSVPSFTPNQDNSCILVATPVMISRSKSTKWSECLRPLLKPGTWTSHVPVAWGLAPSLSF